MKSTTQFILAFVLIAIRLISRFLDIKVIQPIDDVFLALAAVLFTTALSEASKEKENNAKFNFYYNLIGTEISMSMQRINQIFDALHQFKNVRSLGVIDAIPTITQFPPEIYSSSRGVRKWFYSEIGDISALNKNISGLNFGFTSLASEVSQLKNMTIIEQAETTAIFIKIRIEEGLDSMLLKEEELKKMTSDLYVKHKELMSLVRNK